MRSMFLIFFLILSGVAAGQYSEENAGYFRHPAAVDGGVISSDNFGSSLYLHKDGKITKMFSSPGCGYNYEVAPDGKKIGIKLINEDGEQAPALLDLKGEARPLERFSHYCGQIHFFGRNSWSYTVGEKLVIYKNGTRKEYRLNNYSNIAPVSPDGGYVVYNDDNDQLFLRNLESGREKEITDGAKGYFHPDWSPDGRYILFRGLDLTIYIYNFSSGETTEIGKGREPEWASDSKSIIFCRVESEDIKFISSDIYLYSVERSATKKLTDTPGIHEMDPAFSSDGNNIIYQTYSDRGINSAEISERGIISVKSISHAEEQFQLEPNSLQPDEIETPMEVPYLHQVYDTPDWHNGHWSCAPTTSAMVLGYYNILPKWKLRCSYPHIHYSYFGRYIAEEYYFRITDYNYTADDAGGNPTKGGYGYMWGTGSPHSRMSSYYSKHGFQSSQTYSATWQTPVNEISLGFPYTMCVMITSSGHLILAHDVYGDHTLTYNDPYGNKNTPGYPTYDGKNVQYDWPGYNNGFANIESVAWSISTHIFPEAEADTLVDDSELQNGFYLHTDTPSEMMRYKDMLQGYGNHFWYTKTTAGFPTDTAYAQWTPTFDRKGAYEVQAYIPFSEASDAGYKIYHKDGIAYVPVAQKNYTDEWVSLGIYNFPEGDQAFVRLGDGSSVAGESIVFDAMRFIYIDSVTTVRPYDIGDIPGDFYLAQNYPNPFNPSTTIGFGIPNSGNVKLDIWTVTGENVATLIDENLSAGKYKIDYKAAENLASGIYLYTLRHKNNISSRKFILLK